jgi:hypothetical protein
MKTGELEDSGGKVRACDDIDTEGFSTRESSSLAPFGNETFSAQLGLWLSMHEKDNGSRAYAER